MKMVPSDPDRNSSVSQPACTARNLAIPPSVVRFLSDWPSRVVLSTATHTNKLNRSRKLKLAFHSPATIPSCKGYRGRVNDSGLAFRSLQGLLPVPALSSRFLSLLGFSRVTLPDTSRQIVELSGSSAPVARLRVLPVIPSLPSGLIWVATGSSFQNRLPFARLAVPIEPLGTNFTMDQVS